MDEHLTFDFPTIGEALLKLQTPTVLAYRFWSAAEGEYVFRLLPDGDPDNSFFWLQQDCSKYRTIKTTRMDVDTGEVISEQIAKVRDGLPQIKNISQGFVVSSPSQDDPFIIRKLVFGLRSIFKYLLPGLMSEKMQYMPTDYDHGMDFRFVRRTCRLGDIDYSEYLEVDWTWTERPLSMPERQAIETQGLVDLRTWLYGRNVP